MEKMNTYEVPVDITHDIVNCAQAERLVRIEALLADNNIKLAVIDERLKSMQALHDQKFVKYDDHITAGDQWRRNLVGVSVILLLNIAGTIWWGAVITEKMNRFERLHPYGIQIDSQKG